MGVDWDNDDAILEDFANQGVRCRFPWPETTDTDCVQGEDKSKLFIMETSSASDTLKWGPKNTEGACVEAGDPIGRVQVGGCWEHVDSSESKVYVGKAEKEGKYQNAAVKWIGRR